MTYQAQRNPRDSWSRTNIPERRLDTQSANLLAQTVFGKYDDNHSGYMNSMEAAKMISDLYASINMTSPVNPQEGMDLLIANDVESDHQLNLKDFQKLFVQTLSTKNDTGYSLTDPFVYQGITRTSPGRVPGSYFHE